MDLLKQIEALRKGIEAVEKARAARAKRRAAEKAAEKAAWRKHRRAVFGPTFEAALDEEAALMDEVRLVRKELEAALRPLSALEAEKKRVEKSALRKIEEGRKALELGLDAIAASRLEGAEALQKRISFLEAEIASKKEALEEEVARLQFRLEAAQEALEEASWEATLAWRCMWNLHGKTKKAPEKASKKAEGTLGQLLAFKGQKLA